MSLKPELLDWAIDNGWLSSSDNILENLNGKVYDLLGKSDVRQARSKIVQEMSNLEWYPQGLTAWAKRHGFVEEDGFLCGYDMRLELEDVWNKGESYHNLVKWRRRFENRELVKWALANGWVESQRLDLIILTKGKTTVSYYDVGELSQSVRTTLIRDAAPKRRKVKEKIHCPNCNAEMIRRQSDRGSFWGCSNFPECRGARPDSRVIKVDRAKVAEYEKRLKLTFDFIEAMGDTQTARQWVGIVERMNQ